MKQPTEKTVVVVIFSLESDTDTRETFYTSLSDDEQRRARAFHFDKHRNRFITGRASIRNILGSMGNCSPRSIKFNLNEYGKPSIGNPDSIRHLEFNASSSDAVGAIAITKGLPLGLDMEKVIPDQHGDFDIIVKSEFSKGERDWYYQQDQTERTRVFFELWTCKEAYLKALGVGLNGKLNRFSVNLQRHCPIISDTELECEGRSTLKLVKLSIVEGFAACLAMPCKPDRIDITRW